MAVDKWMRPDYSLELLSSVILEIAVLSHLCRGNGDVVSQDCADRVIGRHPGCGEGSHEEDQGGEKHIVDP